MPALNIIIPAAGFGHKQNQNVPKSLIQINDSKLIDLQIAILRKYFPDARITYIVGFQRDKLKSYREQVRLIINRDFENTGVAYSIGLGLQRQLSKTHCLIIYGDLIFNETLLATIKEKITSKKSFVLVDDENPKKNEIGVNVYQDSVLSFSYQPALKWEQIAYLNGRDSKLFAKLALQKKNINCYGHEILNLMLSEGRELQLAKRKKSDILIEIDSSRDVMKAKTLLNREVVL